jgi:hypothetical protein
LFTMTAPETDPDTIIEGREPHPRKWQGLFVHFDLKRANGTTTREKGEIIASRWLGFTQRGRIPEYEVQIRGSSGRVAIARITRDHVQPL